MSTTESPAPKSRGRHRANKSTPHANLTTPSKPQYNNTQSTLRNVVTPPQSPAQVPKAQQSSPNTSAKKNKRKSKPRPRDLNTDVHHVHQGYDSPTASSNDESNAFPPTPTRGVMSTPTKAYAGPNFHSSPNPSSLPVPSWFSKSVPATPSTGTSLQAMLELSEETLSQSLEEPESHLQKLFRADKEEKAKRASAVASAPMLATLAHGSREISRRQSPDSLDNSFTDVFAMDPEKTIQTPASEMAPQALFSALPQAPRVLAGSEARRQANALRSFLTEPQMSPVGVEAVAERPANQPTAPFTPTKRRPSPPQHGSHTAPRAQFQTPTKKAPSQSPRLDHNPHFIMTPKGPRSHHSGYHQTPQTPTPVRDHYNHPTYPNRNNIKSDSVLQLTEMELYLRRVLNLENRAIATPAAAS